MYAALLGDSRLPVDQICKRIEIFYTGLNKEKYTKGESLQSLSHLLTLSEQPETGIIERLKELDQLIYKNYKTRLRGEFLPYLGFLALSDLHPLELVQRSIEGAEFLKVQPQYDSLNADNVLRFLISSMLIISESRQREQIDGAVEMSINSIQSLLLAQHVIDLDVVNFSLQTGLL